MKRRIFFLIALTAVGAASLIGFRRPATPVAPPALATEGSNDFLVAYYPGITLADVVKTHRRFFDEAVGDVTIDRRDRSLHGRGKSVVFSSADFLWKQTGERWQFLSDITLRCYPASQEIKCSSPASNQITLYSDDSIVVPSRGGMTVVLGLYP